MTTIRDTAADINTQQEQLIYAYQVWTAENDFSDEGDAMEILCRDDITPSQRDWLKGFLAEWEAAA